LLFQFIALLVWDVTKRAIIEDIIGHGLADTMWKGWNLFIIKMFRYSIV
jgi:hypothetical protein